MTPPFASVRAALDRRLDSASRAPLAIGFSGGGDSLALLHLVLDWAKAVDRRVLALTVDHGVHPDSAHWTVEAGEKARGLGADWRALVWTGAKPATGLPAAARRARHALLADAAREAGARVVLMGHTQNDIAEGEIMRTADAPGLGRLREWAPSPVWPEGRGVFILRPLLSVRRESLREFLRNRGETWLDDPANKDLRHPRVRARREAEVDSGLPPTILDPAIPQMARSMTIFPTGWVVGFSLAGEPARAARHVLGALLVSVSGSERPPKGAVLDRLIEAMESEHDIVRTAGGCVLEIGKGTFIMRAAPPRGGEESFVDLPPKKSVVWSGRCEVTAQGAGWRVGPVKGLVDRLSPRDARFETALRNPRNSMLLALVRKDRVRYTPTPWEDRVAKARFLGDARFAAATGLLRSEAEANDYDALEPHDSERCFLLRRTHRDEAPA